MKKSLVLVSGLVAGLLLLQSADAEILVIGSKDSGIQHLTPEQISGIYLGTSSQQLKPYDQPTYSKAYAEFYSKILHKSPDQISNYWATQTFQGLGSAPAKINSISELFSLIQNYPQVIGYVDSDQVPASYLQSVQVYYAEPGYHPDLLQTQSLQPVALSTKPRKYHPQAPTALPVEQAPGLWGEVLASSHWDHFYRHQGVQKEIEKFASAGDLQKRVEDASPYLGYVYSQTKKMGIPAQFALLPLMESNYNPEATNRNGAGLWQLERATAGYMGIPVNSRYDGRRDIVVSTHAALQHLLDEFNRFHNWQLAAAAYNCGTGPVESAVKNNLREGKSTNFWAIRSQLPHITQAYVPRLVALSYMLKHAKHYGIDLPDLSTKPSLVAVPVKQVLTLAEISELSGASLNELKKLNPGLLDGKTSADKLYHLLLPASVSEDFSDNLRSMNQEKVRELAAKKQAAAVASERKQEALQEKKRRAQERVRKQEPARVRLEQELKTRTPVKKTPTKKKSSEQNLKSLLNKIYE